MAARAAVEVKVHDAGHRWVTLTVDCVVVTFFAPPDVASTEDA